MMDILIFSIGFLIFATYMFFLLRMINKTHKSQEKAQNKYKRQINVTRKRRTMSADDCERVIKNARNYISSHEKRKQFPYSKR